MQIHFIDLNDQIRVVDGEIGESLMHCATRHQILGIFGECGGALACATCHSYLTPPDGQSLEPPSAQESALLEGCLDVRANSRLTCQIALTPALDGLKVKVPATQT